MTPPASAAADAGPNVFITLGDTTVAASPAVGESTGRHPAQGDRQAERRDRPSIAFRAWNMGMVSIVIVVTNRRRELETVLRSMTNMGANPVEVIVVDDGSTDDTWKWMQKSVTGAVLCRNEKPVGLVDAATQGINVSIGEFIGVIDLTGPVDKVGANHKVVPRSYYEMLGRYQR